MAENVKILWVDDEVDLLNVHIIFLERKGYLVKTATNAQDAFDILKQEKFDIIFLDENMPGITGLNALPQLKEYAPHTPVIMVTKSEDEAVMDEAIGSQVADYLIKPVKPQQILLTIKKNVFQKDLITEKTGTKFREEFNKLSNEINSASDWQDWTEIYRKLTHWTLLLDEVQDEVLLSILESLKQEANRLFARQVKNNYEQWIKSASIPNVSNIIQERVLPVLQQNNGPVFLIVIDNLRYDHWRELRSLIHNKVSKIDEQLISSILPTATQYARNALFAGLMPLDIKRYFPNIWRDDTDEGNKNEYEAELFQKLLKRNNIETKFNFYKVFNDTQGQKIVSNLKNLLNSRLNIIVYNFIDMLSHAKTNMQMVKELAKDESSYRAVVKSWFRHSSIYQLFEQLTQYKATIFITTDHGAVRVKNPVKVIGDRETTTNIRYKQGKNLNYPDKKVYAIVKPEKIGLPKSNIVNTYIFALENDFFVYPNNYHQFVNYYKDSFQHGGVSMEEMLIPFVKIQTH